MRSKATGRRFQQLFGANRDDIHAYCLRRLPREQASDAVSEVFLVAWRRFGEIPPGDGARLWLFGVARNVVRNFDRSSRRRSRTTARVGGLATAHPADPETLVLAAAEHSEIMDAFLRLNRGDQEILRLRLWEELSTKAIATVVGCSDKAASKRYQRALSRLTAAARTSTAPANGPHLARGGGEL